MDKLRATNPHALEAEGLCRGGSLGLYMVRYTGGGYRVIASMLTAIRCKCQSDIFQRRASSFLNRGL